MRHSLSALSLATGFLSVLSVGVIGASEVEPIVVTLADSDRAYLSIGAWGELGMTEEGCLVIDETSLMIWQTGTRASRTEDGRIEVIDGTTGKRVYVGDTIGFGGGGAAVPYPDELLTAPVPEPCRALGFTMGAWIQTPAELEEQARKRASTPPVASPPGY